MLTRGDYAAALRACLAIVARHPDDANAWFLAGQAAVMMRDETAAIDYLSRAVEHAPRAAAPRAWLARLHRDAGRFDDALKTFQDAWACTRTAATALDLGSATDAAAARTMPDFGT